MQHLLDELCYTKAILEKDEISSIKLVSMLLAFFESKGWNTKLATLSSKVRWNIKENNAEFWKYGPASSFIDPSMFLGSNRRQIYAVVEENHTKTSELGDFILYKLGVNKRNAVETHS